MDLYITTSSRLTPAEEKELRGNSGSTEQLKDPTLNDYPIKSAKLGSATASPVIPAVVSPSFSVLDAPSSAATGPVKPKMLMPIAIVSKNQQQQSESQQGSPGRRSIDAGCKETLQEEVRSQIQASASMDDDRDDLETHHPEGSKRTRQRYSVILFWGVGSLNFTHRYLSNIIYWGRGASTTQNLFIWISHQSHSHPRHRE
ncbi:hypothetical protein EC957_007021 [Mortierella hygrophila]|uniref:Uncharacterized protein n=1 Tax=Mortierella hygrophila TaxID=979708 RepID=A0A9P6FDE4_9FUNG|nr:hypothetical protein EC957_007021 [Mortierella hygrophila]